MRGMSDPGQRALISLENMRSSTPKGSVPQRTVDSYNRYIRTLSEDFPGIEEWYIGDELLERSVGPSRASLSGNVLSPGQPYGEPWVRHHDFVRRLDSAIEYARMEARRFSKEAFVASPDIAIRGRIRLFANMLEACLQEDSSICWWPYMVTRLHHSSFDGNWAKIDKLHIDALVQDQMLTVAPEGRAEGERYSIPNRYLTMLRNFPGFASATTQDERRTAIERFVEGLFDVGGNFREEAKMPTKLGGAPVVFIGHGHTELWRPLKDFVKEELQLDARPFEHESRVGKAMKDVLESFKAEADCAIILLTSDDLQSTDTYRARQNVVHEIGFFQGSVGFDRVAMVVQNGLEEFSNVAGIIPIRFQDRHIEMVFEPIRKWLKREKLTP